MTPEKQIQDAIRSGCADIARLYRANVGVFKTLDGRVVNTGLPKGFPDLFGYRLSDGKFIAIEVKAPRGRVRLEQEQVLNSLISQGIPAGVARSVEEARHIIMEGDPHANL